MTIDPMDSPRSPRPIEKIDPSASELDEGTNNEKARTDYVLRGGDAGAERLRLLAQVVWPTTERLLDRAGVAPGMRCLDVGCGIGAVTVELARRVGPSGHVLGIDFD